ncbi:MAG: nucleotidyltransferase family protein, partial [Desulfobacterales bacterium]|nr:nucleotidyltransferase family protein [Desulfobacterales bacterium]
MVTPKLKHVVSVITAGLSEKKIPHALIGAMALSSYGMPRFSADIDLLSVEEQRRYVLDIMKRLGYECFQDAGSFAQFDSELGVYGKVDFMFVNTDYGRAMLERSRDFNDEVMGVVPVVQPTDYAVLKLMAIANNLNRMAHDMADLEVLFKAAAEGLLNRAFDPINIDQLQIFAERFQVVDHLNRLLTLLKKTQ